MRLAALALLATQAAANPLNTVGIIPALTGGGYPQPGLVPMKGTLYGTAFLGGTHQSGLIFAMNPTTGAETPLYNFTAGPDGANPNGNLLPQGGLLYGTTRSAGTNGAGTVFAFNPATNTLTTLYAPPKGPAGVPYDGPTALNGLLYAPMGIQNQSVPGGILAVNPATQTGSIVFTFSGSTNGQDPIGPLTAAGGLLYGVTSLAGPNFFGTVFAFNPTTAQVTTLHGFGSGSGGDGDTANGGLTAIGTTLYGTTLGGGTNGAGTIYTIDTTSGAYAVTTSFTIDCASPSGPLLQVGSLLYGNDNECGFLGGVYAFDPAALSITPVVTFAESGPFANANGTLANIGNTLYGVTDNGRQLGATGTVFAAGTDGNLALLRQFFSSGYYNAINAGLTPFGTLLYGTAEAGGANDCGSVYSVAPATGAITTLYSFACGADGATPLTNLTPFNNKLYGTTPAGGTGQGVIFSFDPATNTETVIHTFAGPDGATPRGPLLAIGNTLYGTTSMGGTNAGANDFGGTLFSLDAAGTLTTLYNFGATNDVTFPTGPLLASGAKLYGAAAFYNAVHGHVGGGIYAYSTTTAHESVLAKFTSSNRQYPYGDDPTGVTLLNNTLYGTTSIGGTSNLGTLFSLPTTGGTPTVLYNFPAGPNKQATSPLLARKGLLYGTTLNSLYSFNPATNTLQTLATLKPNAPGQDLFATPLPLGNLLWGTTAPGKQQPGAGTIYKTKP